MGCQQVYGISQIQKVLAFGTAFIIQDPDDWKYISACVPGTDPKMCQFRFLNLHKNKLSNYQWKEE